MRKNEEGQREREGEKMILVKIKSEKSVKFDY